MTDIIPNISSNRIQLKDKENKVLVQDLSKLKGSSPINDVPELSIDSALLGKGDALNELKKLESDIPNVDAGSLEDGSCVKKMFETGTTVGDSPELRKLNATISTVGGEVGSKSQSMWTSVNGSISSAVSQVPGAISKIGEIPGNVKSFLLADGVKNHADSKKEGGFSFNGPSVKSFVDGAKNLLSTTKEYYNIGKNTYENGKEVYNSVMAAKQSFDYMYGNAKQDYDNFMGLFKSSSKQDGYASGGVVGSGWGPLTGEVNWNDSTDYMYKPPETAESESDRALSKEIDRTLEFYPGVEVVESGTTSQLLPAAPTDGSLGYNPQLNLRIRYNEHALVALVGLSTWYRALTTRIFSENNLPELQKVYGTPEDHAACAMLLGTEVQSDRLRNFEALIGTVTPDNPSRDLFIHNTYKKYLDLMLAAPEDLEGKSPLQIACAYLGLYLTSNNIKPHLTEMDYDLIAANVRTQVEFAKLNFYHVTDSQEEFDTTTKVIFSSLVTDAVLYHITSPETIAKKIEVKSQILMYCWVWLTREFLNAYNYERDSEVRSNLLKTIRGMLKINLETVEASYTDQNEFIFIGSLLYWKPDDRALRELTYPLVSHYYHNSDKIKKSREFLLYQTEFEAFDALTLRFEALTDSGLPEIEAITNANDYIDYYNPSPEQTDMVNDLIAKVIETGRAIHEIFSLPKDTFERYSMTVDDMYFDRTAAMLK